MGGDKLHKKILFLASWYPSKENPTLGNFVMKHAEVANEVAEIDVLYAVSIDTVQETIIKDEWVNNVRTVIINYPKVQSKIPILKSVLRRREYIKALKLGYRRLNKEYDLVHLNVAFPAGIFAQWMKRNVGIPYILTVHWTGFLPQNPVFNKLSFPLRLKYKSIFRDAKNVYTVSDHLGESLINLGLIHEYQVINNVVQTAFFYPTNDQREDALPPRFLHISTFNDEHKNVSGMLSAFAQLQCDFKLHIITEGDQESVWEAINRFKIAPEKCIVECKRSPTEVGEAMRLADCLVLFSNYETFSVVLAEAWTSGIPAIYTKCGGLTEINNSDLGKQLLIGDEKALFRELKSFKRIEYSRLKISEFGQSFSSDSLRKKFLEIYR